MKNKMLLGFLLLMLTSGLGLTAHTLLYATVNEVTPAANRYTANGSTVDFAYTWKILRKQDIEVIVDSVTKVIDVNYTVSGVGSSGGGTVTFLSAPANASVVTLLRTQPASQLSVYSPGEPFPSTRVEKDFDKLVMQVQQLAEQVGRALKFQKLSTLTAQDIDPPTAGLFARSKAGGGIDWATPTNAGPLSSPVSVANGGTGATTAAGARTNLLSYSENTLIDAKGDLLVGSADNALTRLAPPTVTGYVPVYDGGASTTGITWGPRAQPNPVINGNMDVWQRGTSFAGIVAALTAVADRWNWDEGGTGVVTVSRSTNVPSVAQSGVLFAYSLEVDVTTADASIGSTDEYAIRQKIEGYNWRHFAQRALVVSFWVSSTKTGVHTIALLNSVPDRSYIGEYTVSVADTWEYKTVTILASPSAGTWNYTTGVGAELAFVLAAGSSLHTTAGAWQTGGKLTTSSQVNVMDSTANFFRLTGVKMEVGSVATPIQYRSFQDELQLCKRYYQKSFNYATAPAQNVGANTGELVWPATVAGANAQNWPFVLPVPMRAAPASNLTTYNPQAANAQVRNQTDSADLTNGAIIATGESALRIQMTGTAGTALGEMLAVHWTADAEL